MGYFGSIADRNQMSKEEPYDRYRYYRYCREIKEETAEQDDWAFEERD